MSLTHVFKIINEKYQHNSSINESLSHHQIVPYQAGRKWQLLDRVYIHLEKLVLVIIVVQGLGRVDEGELRQRPAHQRLSQYFCPLGIESIVDHLEGHFGH